MSRRPEAGRRDVDVADLVERARAGQVRAVARLLSLVESDSAHLRGAMTLLAPHTGHAQVVGLTGAPGVGKSTSTNALITALRARGRTVGVLAVDPSSPFSGGALLGDRIRMEHHAGDPGVLIRSMASRGHLGGLSAATPQAVRVLDAAGFDVVLVETVGVGQSEVEVAGLADTTVVLLAPGMGDGIQAAKAGILEVGDVYVVNKADAEGAGRLRRELRGALSMAERGAGEWEPPVVSTVASRAEGVDDVLDALAAHREWSVATGALGRRRLARARAEVEAVAVAELRRRWADLGGSDRLDALAREVAAGRLGVHTAADALVQGRPQDG
ncbi:methylmalonyl Co-A mutase-associated GTPase MeaB [Nocardioides sp. GY 10127]|uniref:methylmalonyl Co-A mutase-associated GTPase MeaB n=1 Tax=Nocardioides sp. GY 10127 TaxID=2569762 RepID=UPI0010A8684F|nr:methylmalonyl Co-A mutase-associated GTPase MeaB [Nocardioides sp. GY 10127]TIC84032.1 methylmalonyl Co-A mutase-associated GTPase MeaB [Nocardioides sp. GY 10127]